MKFKSQFCVRLLPLLLLMSFGAGEPKDFRTTAIQHGEAALKLIQDKFYLPRRGVYLQEIRTDDGKGPYAADAWTSGIQLTALTAAAHVEPGRYLPDVRRYVGELDAYWVTAKGYSAYNSSIHARSPDRYYDDNEWIILGLVEAYELTHDQIDLDRAKAAMKFVLSAEDETLGGGLYWQEEKKVSKNTCSNAPGICAALRVFQYTNDPELLKAAKRLYDWTRAHLQDSDGLYFDAINLDGKIGRTKYTYNSALMIRSGCLLYDQTHDAAYLKEAERVAAASVGKWVRPRSGAIGGPAYFAHLLADAMLDLSARDHDPRWKQVDHTAIEFIENHNHDADGYYPEKWDESEPAAGGKERMINQASAARAYFRAAWE